MVVAIPWWPRYRDHSPWLPVAVVAGVQKIVAVGGWRKVWEEETGRLKPLFQRESFF